MMDQTPLTFGKYKGQTPDEISEEDPSYIVWLFENVQGVCTRDLYLACSEYLED